MTQLVDVFWADVLPGGAIKASGSIPADELFMRPVWPGTTRIIAPFYVTPWQHRYDEDAKAFVTILADGETPSVIVPFPPPGP